MTGSISDGKNQPSIWEQLKNQIYVGSDDYIEQLQKTIAKDIDVSEVPSSQRRSTPKSLDYYAERFKDRDRAIQAAYKSGDYSMKAISEYFGLHYSSISRIINGKFYAQ